MVEVLSSDKTFIGVTSLDLEEFEEQRENFGNSVACRATDLNSDKENKS